MKAYIWLGTLLWNLIYSPYWKPQHQFLLIIKGNYFSDRKNSADHHDQ